jgi:hypothetical protein
MFKLHGDGLRLNMYQMFWTKTSEHKMTKTFRVPDTIIYKLKFPTYWVFTSKRTGFIKNKTEVHIKKDNILKCFLKKGKTTVAKRQSEIVA